MKQNHSKPAVYGYGYNYNKIQWTTSAEITSLTCCCSVKPNRRARIVAFVKRLVVDLFRLASRKVS